MAQIHIVPTLAAMADIYRLSREGGASSPRFTRYLDLVCEVPACVAYNPMAGPHALEATEQLLALQAEALALDAATETVHRCRYTAPIALAVVLCAPGLWTDRIATEVEHRTRRRAPSGVGNVMFWSREIPTAALIRREASAETVRVA